MEINNNISQSIKITLLGNSGVGKTSIILRYIDNNYNENPISTKGANYMPKNIKIKDKIIRLDIWDTAGQEQYRSLGKHFYKDSFIVILVYDITNKQSFEDLKNIWYNNLKIYGEKYSILGIVGNKFDMFDNEEVSEDEAREFAEEKNASFMLVSAKNGSNINNLFSLLVNKYLDPFFQEQIEEETNDKAEGSIKLRKRNKEEKIINLRKKSCC